MGMSRPGTLRSHNRNRLLAAVVIAGAVLLPGTEGAALDPPKDIELRIEPGVPAQTTYAGISGTAGAQGAPLTGFPAGMPKDLPDFEVLDRDEFLGKVEVGMATSGFSERVDHFSGTLHLNMVDLVLPGNAGLDIVIQHYYSSNVWNRVDNALLARHVASADPSDRLGGGGWQLHMGKLMNPNPGVNQFTSLIMPDGSTHTLYSRDGYPGQKTTPEGWIHSVDTGTGVHTVQTTSGLTYFFDAATYGAEYYYYLAMKNATEPIDVYQCTRIEDLHGNAIDIEYSAAPGAVGFESRIDRVSFDDVSDLREVVFTYHGTTGVLDTMQLKNDGSVIETWRFLYYYPAFGVAQPQVGGMTRMVNQFQGVAHSLTGDWDNEKLSNPWLFTYYDDTTALTLGRYLMKEVITPRVEKTTYTWGAEVMDTGALACTEAVPTFLTVDTRQTAVGIDDDPIIYEDEATTAYTYTNGGQEGATTSVVTTDSQTSIVLATQEHVFHGWVQPHVYNDADMWRVGRPISSTYVIKDDVGSDLETTTVTTAWLQGATVSLDTRWSSAWAGCGGSRYSAPRKYAKPDNQTRVVERHDSILDPPPVPPEDPASYTTVSSSYDDWGNVGTVSESSDDGLLRETHFTYWQDPTNNIMVGHIQGQDADPAGAECLQYNTLGRVENSYTNPQTDDVTACTATGTIVGARRVELIYDTYGNLSTQTEHSTPNNRITTHTNYVFGRPKDTVITTGTGDDIHYCRDYKPRGMFAWETDGRGCSANYQTAYAYDYLGRRTSVDPPLSDPVIYSYPTLSSVQAFVTRGNQTMDYRFDRIGSGNLTAIHKHIGATPIETQLLAVTNDALGRRRQVQQRWNSRLGDSAAYDPLGRLVTITHPDTPTTQVSINYSGSSVTVTDENNHVTSYEFEAYGDPNDRRLLSLTDAGTNVTNYGYDSVLGNLNSVDAPILKGDRSFAYYSGTAACNNGFIASETLPESGTTSYAYNCLGDITSRSRPGPETTTYDYDYAGRLTDINFTGTASSIDFGYDQAGRRTSVSNDHADSTFVYDDAGRISTVTQSIVGGPQSQVTSYTYDTLDRLQTITYPSARVVTYGWNDDNWLASVTGADGSGVAYLSSLTHHVTGAVDLITFGNTVTTDHGIDDRNRLSSIVTAASGGQPLNVTFGYDDASNLTTWDDNLGPNLDRAFGYDELDRLTSATSANLWGSLSYTYDELGNRETRTLEGVTTTYVYDSNNRLTDLTGGNARSFTYDAVGRLATEDRSAAKARLSIKILDEIFSDGFESGDTSAWDFTTVPTDVFVYTFNGADQLVSVTDGTAPVGEYAYDGDGYRVNKGLGSLYYLRDTAGNTLAEYDYEGELVAEYIYANGRQVAKVMPDGVGGEDFRFFHADHLGSALSITDGVGTLKWVGEYFPFGSEYSSTGEADRYRFTQHELDIETDLLYAKARYYHPDIGRFISIDPVGGSVENSQSWNRYAYVENNPLRSIDPDGKTGLEIALVAPKPLVVPAPPPILVGAAGFGIGYKAGRTLGRSEIVPGDTIDEFYTDLFYNLLFNENTSESDESDSSKESAKDRRAREQREARERKHGDSDWEEPASEDYAKWKARELERAQGKDARRSAHDAKGKGEGDRSKSRLDSDYGTE